MPKILFFIQIWFWLSFVSFLVVNTRLSFYLAWIRMEEIMLFLFFFFYVFEVDHAKNSRNGESQDLSAVGFLILNALPLRSVILLYSPSNAWCLKEKRSEKTLESEGENEKRKNWVRARFGRKTVWVILKAKVGKNALTFIRSFP